MACRFSELVVDSRDPEALAAFWAAVLDYQVLGREEDGSVEIGPAEGFGGAAPTLVFGGAEDMLAGTPAAFQEGMKRIAATIPSGKARLELLPGLGHVPFVEDPERSLRPLLAFLKEGLAR